MKKAAIVIYILSLTALVGFGAYKYGYSAGHKTGVSDGRKNMVSRTDYDQILGDKALLQVQYDSLQGNYNKLAGAASALRAQASKPIYCSTYNYSYTNSSSTTCY